MLYVLAEDAAVSESIRLTLPVPAAVWVLPQAGQEARAAASTGKYRTTAVLGSLMKTITSLGKCLFVGNSLTMSIMGR